MVWVSNNIAHSLRINLKKSYVPTFWSKRPCRDNSSALGSILVLSHLISLLNRESVHACFLTWPIIFSLSHCWLLSEAFKRILYIPQGSSSQQICFCAISATSESAHVPKNMHNLQSIDYVNNAIHILTTNK